MANLNKEQYRASRADGGVHLVIAGAGTGKTVTLVEKVRSILALGNVQPERILTLTFSRKAAEELKERLLASGEGEAVSVGTFHSYALSILRRFANDFLNDAGFDAFPTIMEDEDKDNIIGELIRERRGDFFGMPDVAVRRSLERENWSQSEQSKLKASGLFDAFERLKSDLEERKKALRFMDFEDIITYCNRLLSRRVDLLQQITDSLDYILVDEYQDTSDNNFELLKLLTYDGKKNLFVVGDDWQAIYGFRNARVEYILNMSKYFQNITVHKLTCNYRSREEIVSLSNKFIRGNKNRTKKRLSSSKGRGGLVAHYGVKSQTEELSLLRNILARDKGEAAVLFRNNWQREVLLKKFPDLAERENLSLLTMHASKGLEFDSVIIIGVDDAIIPDKNGKIEEERRLFYVALSRAKERLYIISRLNDRGELSLFGKELAVPLKRA